jgi:hypothetical protein
MKQWSIILFILAWTSSCSSQQNNRGRYSLLTWEYKREGGGVVPGLSKVILVKYHWADSGYTRTELFHTGYMLPNFSQYKTTVHNNYYLVNSIGDVFDLNTNTLIHEHIGMDPLINKNEDELFFRHISYTPNPPFHNDTKRHTSIHSLFYSFNLRTRKINELTSPPFTVINEPDYRDFLSLPSVQSPDGKKLAYFLSDKKILMDSSVYLCGWTRIYPTYGNLFVKMSTGDSIIVADSVLFESTIRAENYLPLIWLNNEELLTQKSNGNLISINVTTGKTTLYPVIKGVRNCAFTTRFEKTATNDIFYYCRTDQGDLFHINTKNQTINPTQMLPLTPDYSYQIISGHPNNEYAKAYYYKGSKITYDTTTTVYHAITPDGFIAIQCKEMIPSKNQYDHWNEIRVYDPHKKDEVVVKVELLQQLIGWVKNE